MRNGPKKSVKKKSNWAFRIVVLATVAFVLVQLVQLQTQINEKKALLAEQQAEQTRMELYNEALEEQIENEEDQLEQAAREEGLIYPGEQIYQVIPEN